MDYQQALGWLDEHVDLEKGATRRVAAPTLERIRELTSLLGSPQSAYPVVHVTGTNGKTSTARMIAALLAARGLSVGLYTSPHLERVNERLAWNGEPVGDDELADLVDAVHAVEPLMDARPSYFEILTAAAFAWFADIAVDVAVLEVGIGGAWDATNVADASVAVVTNVAIDHVEYLGPTREEIAREKAGIVKPGAALILGETDPELAPLFTARRPQVVYRRDVDFGVRRNSMAHGGRFLEMFSPAGTYGDLYVPLHGGHQADNAACALAAAEAFFGGAGLDAEVVAQAFQAVRVPGRLEVVGHRPLVLLDGAHNPAGALALRAALAEEFPSSDRTLVVGLLREKEPHEMLEALGARDAARLVVCRPPSPRGLDPEIVAAAAKNIGVPSSALEVVEHVSEAVVRALLGTPPDGQIVVAGSLYTVGAARAALVRR